MPRILVVEDEPSIQQLLQEVLRRPGWEVRVASRISEARSILFEGDVDVAVLDKNLPDGCGLALIPLLVARTPDVESIVMTAFPTIDSAIEALQLHVFEYLEKPFDIPRLVRSIEHAVEKVSLRREQERLHAELAQSEARYALAAAASHDALWEWDTRSGRLYLAPRWWEILGEDATPGARVLEDWFDRVHPEDLVHVRAALDEHLAGRSAAFSVEYRVVGAREERWVLSRGLTSHDGRRVAGSHTDITERRRAEEQLRHDALHDALTGLPNHALFRDRLRVALAKLRRRPSWQAAVLFLDVDRFKNVNDSLGHLVGDRLLIQLGQRIKGVLRDTDTCARLGGDEFAILLDELGDLADAEVIAQRIRAALAEPFHVDGREVFASASIGIAVCAPDDERCDVDDVVRRADAAMYRAKARGKARHEVFEGSMMEAPRRFLQIETELRRALEREELHLVYQPIVSFGTGKVAGFEALLRWRSAVGNIPPGEFIGVAEETGSIIAIGHWVLEEATRQLQAWRETLPGADELFMSVNVSRRQLASSSFTKLVEQALGKIPANRLKLEVTETALIDDLVTTRAILTALRELGVSIALDDFGTGYSSLSYLHSLPFDTLKVDRSFVSRLAVEPVHTGIVQSILMLGRNLGMTTVAEGVETPEQAASLRARGCGYGQGYLYARPLDPKAVVDYLSAASERPELVA
jgi:diguanylate cyclase (GGDEF)-like protein/PAS domain S-box-containing protein